MDLLRLTSVGVAYGARQALRGISIDVPAGALVALVGPNGSGKTSLLHAIAGTVKLQEGTIHLGDVPLTALDATARARLVASVPQSARLPEGFSVAEVVMMGRMPHIDPWRGSRHHDAAIVAEAMQAAGVESLAGRQVGYLSGGEQQRVLIARALAQQPRVLLLDEATAHLDVNHQTSILGLVRALAQQGRVVLAALHDLNLAALYADHLVLLVHGAVLASGPPAQVLTAELIEQAFGVPVIIAAHPCHGTPLVIVRDRGRPE